MAATRARTGYKDKIVHEEIVFQHGEHFYREYHLGRLLGTGGFAKCHEVRTSEEDHTYAIKIIEKETDIKKKREARETIAKAREEIMILKSLNHPGIVKYHRHFEDSHSIFIVMELCSGGSLNDVLKRRKILTEPEVRYLVAQLVEILRYIQEKNIVHRDIKPANIFLDENFRLKLGDFGLATQNNDELRAQRKLCGTPNYIAPEVIQRLPYGFQIDVWSTGVLIFTMLYGIAPFETHHVKETYERIKKADFKFQGASNAVIQRSEEAKMFIRQLLCVDAAERLKVGQFMSHPFMTNYQVPPELEPTFPISPPSRQFMNLYEKPKNPRPIDALVIPKQCETPPQKIKPKPAISVRFPHKPKGKAYKDILKPPIKPIAYQSIEDHEPIVKIEEFPCKREEVLPQANPQQIQQPYPLKIMQPYPLKIQHLDLKPLPSNQCPMLPKKEQDIANPVDNSEQNTNSKARKKFKHNNIVKMESDSVQFTQKKQKPKSTKLPPSVAPPKPTDQVWRRSPFRLHLKQLHPASHLSADKKEIKIAHWEYCSNEQGVAYILTNHHIGFIYYGRDSECMQLSPKQNKIHYFHRREGKMVDREINVDQIDELRVEEKSILSKVQNLMYYHKILKSRLPSDDEKADNDTISSVCANQTPVYLKNFRRAEGVAIFSLSSRNSHFFFDDGSSMFFSLTSYFVSYQAQGELLVHSIPLDFRSLEAGFSQKVQVVCSYYNRVLKMKAGESERWFSRQEQGSCKQEIVLMV